MDFVENASYGTTSSEVMHLEGSNYMPNCPNCYHMMNEIVELRMELNRMEKGEKRVRKTFTIAPTLYTFYRNGLSKRHLARYSYMIWFIPIDLPVLLRLISWNRQAMMTTVI